MVLPIVSRPQTGNVRRVMSAMPFIKREHSIERPFAGFGMKQFSLKIFVRHRFEQIRPPRVNAFNDFH
jgi:hypothetical protein